MSSCVCVNSMVTRLTHIGADRRPVGRRECSLTESYGLDEGSGLIAHAVVGRCGRVARRRSPGLLCLPCGHGRYLESHRLIGVECSSVDDRSVAALLSEREQLLWSRRELDDSRCADVASSVLLRAKTSELGRSAGCALAARGLSEIEDGDDAVLG